MHRITNNLVGLLDCGFLPNCIHLDPVIWQKRELNVIADHLVNHTMDVRKSWHQICTMPYPDISLRDANFLIHFDGGTRGNDCSAAAWILEARIHRERDIVEFPVAFCGKFVSPSVSSYVAEAMALESCTEIFLKLVLKLVTEPPHKRYRVG